MINLRIRRCTTKMKFEYGFFEYIDADSDNNEESNIRVCVNVSQIPQNIKNEICSKLKEDYFGFYRIHLVNKSNRITSDAREMEILASSSFQPDELQLYYYTLDGMALPIEYRFSEKEKRILTQLFYNGVLYAKTEAELSHSIVFAFNELKMNSSSSLYAVQEYCNVQKKKIKKLLPDKMQLDWFNAWVITKNNAIVYQ